MVHCYHGAWSLQTWSAYLKEIPDNVYRRSPNTVFAVACLTAFLDSFNVGTVIIALPIIKDGLQIHLAYLQWISVAYTLTFGCMLLLGTRARDLYGCRSIVMFGSIVQFIFTIGCALAPTLVVLIVFRAMQAAGAALSVSSTQAHIMNAREHPSLRASALSFWALSTSLGFTIGIILGGVLASTAGWRYIFWIATIFGGILLIPQSLTIPQNTKRSRFSHQTNLSAADEEKSLPKIKLTTRFWRSISHFDLPALFLILASLLMLTFSLTSANQVGWGSVEVICLLVASLASLITLFTREWMAEEPLLPPRLLRRAQFGLNLVVAGLIHAVQYGSIYFLSIQLQSFGNSAMKTSLFLLPLLIAMSLLAFGVGRLGPRLDVRYLTVFGCLIIIVSMALLSLNRGNASYWTFNFPALPLLACALATVLTSSKHLASWSVEHKDQANADVLRAFAMHVVGSVLGPSSMTSIAQGVNHFSGHQTSNDAPLQSVAYRAVYYSNMILCGICLVLTLAFARVPKQMQARFWKLKRKERARSTPKGALTSIDPSVLDYKLPIQPTQAFVMPVNTKSPRTSYRASTHPARTAARRFTQRSATKRQRARMPTMPSRRWPFASSGAKRPPTSMSSMTGESAFTATSSTQSPVQYGFFDAQTMARLDGADMVGAGGPGRVERRSHVVSQHPSWHEL